MAIFAKLAMFLFCILAFVTSSFGATSPKNIFILAGQSNMGGRGGVERNKTGQLVWDGFVPPECEPSPSILKLNKNLIWEEAREPLHEGIDINKTLGIGPGMPFAHRLLAKAGSRAGVVGLVPCARGGTPLQRWLKNPVQPDSTLYEELIFRIKESDKKGGTVRALFWLQGESDAADETLAAVYKSNLVKFFTDIRNDIKPRVLPIIVVKIASYDTYVSHDTHDMEKVRGAQEVSKELADVETVDALQFVKPTGEGFNKDLVHLNTNTEVHLGQALADTYISHFGNFL